MSMGTGCIENDMMIRTYEERVQERHYKDRCVAPPAPHGPTIPCPTTSRIRTHTKPQSVSTRYTVQHERRVSSLGRRSVATAASGVREALRVCVTSRNERHLYRVTSLQPSFLCHRHEREGQGPRPRRAIRENTEAGGRPCVSRHRGAHPPELATADRRRP